MAHQVPKLPYAYDALEPHIDSKTMTIHHSKHHQAYVTNLNKALEGHPDLQEKSALELILDLEKIPSDIRTAVRNHGGGHVNHTMFWTCMAPNGGGEPSGALSDVLHADFGGLDAFRAQFKHAALGQFGSGWTWLLARGGRLVIESTGNADTPLTDESATPLLTLDVWEHAYYLDYQNERNRYVDGFLAALVNWEFAARNFEAVRAAA